MLVDTMQIERPAKKPGAALTVKEFAEDYDISVMTVYRMAHRNELTLTKVGRRTRILPQHIAEWQANSRFKSRAA
jgi:excisionase family DNA binding protein